MSYTYLFKDDYSEGAHPRILEALSSTNLQQESGYGEDSFSQLAKALIKERIGKSKAEVYFVAGGTQANLVCLSSILKPYESVIVPDHGHPNVHEAGAIEATGHKLNIVHSLEGRLTLAGIEEVLTTHAGEHMVMPRAVYISQATELGTIYSSSELRSLFRFCKKHKLYLYIDGARLGNAIMADSANFDLATIAECSDIFFIGGTKNGALLGEAIVITNPDLQENFRYHLKQRGALLAKTRAISVQFLELFKDNLYFDNAKHANEMAQVLAKGIKECGYDFLTHTATNQVFPILPNKVIEKLKQKYSFYVWSRVHSPSDSSAIRLVTSWATPFSAIEDFISTLKSHSLEAQLC